MSKQSPYSVEITPRAKEAVEAVRAKLRMSKKDIIERMMEWFGEQGETVQQMILGTLPSDMEFDVLRAVLERHLANKSPPKAAGRKTAS